MMGGYGSYYSNLSASAPPFTVDRSSPELSPAGFQDSFTESFFHPPVSSPPTTSMPNPQRFSFQQFEEMPYYGAQRFPSVPPYDPPCYGTTERHQAVSTQSENNICYGSHTSAGSSSGTNLYNKRLFTSQDNGGVSFYSRDNHVAPAGTGQVNEKFSTAEWTNFLPAYKPNNSGFGYDLSADSWNSRVSGDVFQEKSPNQHVVCGEAWMGSDIEAHYTVPPLSSLSSERKVCFDPTQISIHLAERDHALAKSNLPENEEPTHTNAHGSSHKNSRGAESFVQDLTFGCDGATNYLKNSFESSDNHNPPVDSPCWKGAPFSLSSLFEVSKEASNGNPVTNASKNPIRLSPLDGHLFLDHTLENSLAGPSAPNLIFEELNAYVANKAEPSKGVCSDDANEPSHKNVLFDRSIDELVGNICAVSEQRLGEGELLISENKSTVQADSSGVRINADNASDVDTSQGQLIAKRNISPPCASSHEAHGAKPLDLLNGELPPKVNTLLMVDTMHNLSEMLLHESTNGRKLKSREFETLKKVMDNLDKCLLETSDEDINQGQSSPSQAQQAEARSSTNLVSHAEEIGATNSHVENMAEIVEPSVNKNAMDGGRTSSDKGLTQGIKNILARNFPDDEEVQQQALLYKNLWLEAEAALCSTTYMARFNRIKNEIGTSMLPIIKESSTKLNSPCGRSSLHEARTSDKFEPSMNRGQASDFRVQNSPVIGASGYENDVMSRLRILQDRECLHSESMNYGTAAENLENLVSPDLSTGDKSKPLMKDSQAKEFPDSYENEVVEMLRILKRRDLHSESVDGKGSEISESFLVPADSSIHDKSELTMKRYQAKAFQAQNSPIIGARGHETNVMSRLQMLKHRDSLQSESVDNGVAADISECFPVFPASSIGAQTGAAMKENQKTDSPIKNLPAIGADIYEDDVMARLHILKRRDLGLESLVTDETENTERYWLSSKDLSDLEALFDSIINIYAQDSPSTHVMDAMNGSQILKCRAHEPNSKSLFSSENVGCPSLQDESCQKQEVGKMNSWNLSVNSHKIVQQPLINHHNDRTNAQDGECSARVHESSVSDWEHVEKEELPGKGC